MLLRNPSELSLSESADEMHLQSATVTPQYSIEEDDDILREHVEEKRDINEEQQFPTLLNRFINFLSNEFLSAHLLSFLCLRDIAKLDTALTNKIYRSVWIKIPKKLGHDHLKLSNIAHIDWCINRNAYFIDVGLSYSILSNNKNQEIIYRFKHCQILTLFFKDDFDNSVTISELSNIIQNTPMLTKLCLEKCESFKNVSFTDIAMTNVSHYCPLLETIELHNANITDRALLTMGKLQYLRDFSLYNDEKMNINVNISNEGIHGIVASKCIKSNNNNNNNNYESLTLPYTSPLERLHIVINSKKNRYCTITESSVFVIANHCLQLKSLSLLINDKSIISNSSITYLVKTCKQLYRINESFELVKKEFERKESKIQVNETVMAGCSYTNNHSRNNDDEDSIGVTVPTTTTHTRASACRTDNNVALITRTTPLLLPYD